MFKDIQTLADLFIARRDDVRTITFFKTDTEKECVSYQQLYNRASGILAMLQRQKIEPQQELIIYLEDPCSFLSVFWAGILGGIIPVPLSVGRTYEQHLKLFLVYQNLSNASVITTRSLWGKLTKTLTPERQAQLSGWKTFFIEDADLRSEDANLYKAKEDQIAYVQFSSGSTNSPKGVTLTHKNILTNCMAILANIDSPAAGDLFFSWMPLTHDMGLIGYHLAPSLAGWDHFIMSTEYFIRKPARWLELASRHQVTFTASPNFGYTCVLKYLQNYSLAGTDLSSIRIITNGAEPISADLCREFERELGPYGLRKNTIFPVYGLAEAGLAVTFSEPGAAVKTLVIDRAFTGETQRIRETDMGEGVEFVSVGRPLENNCSLRLVAAGNVMEEEGVIGQVEINGNNVTSGYYNNPVATTEAIMPEGWLRTGDLGFIKEGYLFITGRSKDIFFVNGQNFYPHDIEAALEQHPQLRAGRIAVAGSFNNKMAKDEVLLFIKNTGKSNTFQTIADELKVMMNKKFGIIPDFVVPVNEIPKTTSGKIQRYKLVRQFKEQQQLDSLGENESMGNRIARNQDINEGTIEALTRIWGNILPTATIRTEQDFFSIGGTSLLVAEMLSQVSQILNKEISLGDFYDHTTIRSLAVFLDARSADRPFAGAVDVLQSQFPLSSDQERLYYHWELDRQSVAYNMPVAIELDGSLSVERLRNAINSLLQQHDILSAIVSPGETPVLRVRRGLTLDLVCEEASEETMDGLLRQSVLPFNLLEDLLYRIKLFRIRDGRHILFADFHHIIADGYSLSVFFRKLLMAYNGEPHQVQVSYGTFLQWLNNKRRDDTNGSMRSFWQHYLGEDLPQVQLPLDFARPPVFDSRGKKLSFNLDVALKEGVAAFGRANAMSPFMVYLAAFKIFLSKLSGQEDVTTGLAVSLRELSRHQESIGMFTNSVIVRSYPAGNKKIKDFLQSFRSELLLVMANKTYPVVNAVKEFRKHNDLSRNVGFDTMFVYQDLDLVDGIAGELTCKKYFFDPGFSKYDLTIELFDIESCFYIEYAESLFSSRTIEYFADYYKLILSGVCSSTIEYISDINILSIEEEDVFLDKYNNARMDYPFEVSVLSLIAKQVAIIPGHTAVKEGDTRISFKELDQRATQLAGCLRNKGVTEGEPVAIWLERSASFIIAALAVWKAGGCFVPLDTSSPSSRIQYILGDCKAKVVITDATLQGAAGMVMEGGLVQLIDEQHLVTDKASFIDPAPATSAYIIYTSGTTGDPKGVVVTHQSFSNYIYWAIGAYMNEEAKNFAFYTSVSFDLTLTSVFAPLVYGGMVVVFREEGDSLPVQMVVKDPQVSVFKATPSHLRLLAASDDLIDYFDRSNIRCIIVGGEALTVALAQEIHALFSGRVKIFNEYGPTEATVGCMTHLYDPLLDKRASMPIGVPINNTAVFLLDAYHRPVPYNVTGEMFIAGDCLAKEYLGQPGLTERKFIPHLLLPGKKMYRTGDYARRLYSGLLEYVGRKDKQVKLKGYRIELDEIEAILSRHPRVDQAIIVLKNITEGDAFLAAYIIPAATDDRQMEQDLRKYLQALLPAYSLPRCYILVDSVPLTANGKLDENALPEPEEIGEGQHLVVAETPIEAHVASVWQDVLKIAKVNVTDNFYWLGGDSIKAVQIASRLRDIGIHINAREIMRYPEIRELCTQASFVGTAVEEQQEVVGDKDLSPIEHWFFSRNLNNPDYYNQTIVVRFRRDISMAIVNRVFRLLVDHHDGLRLNYDKGKDRMVMKPSCSDQELKVEKVYCDKNEWPIAGEALKQTFTISDKPLIKMVILNQDDSNHLFITAHHLVIDGFSWRILMEDFHRLYLSVEAGEQPLLPLKSASLLRYQSALRQFAQDELTEQDLDFWRSMESFVPGMPFDIIPVASLDSSGISTAFLDRDTSGIILTDVSKELHISAETILLTALVCLLKERTGSELVKIEMEHHGRDILDVDVSRTIGWFTSIYPLVFSVEAQKGLEQVEEVKKQLNRVPHKGMSYGMLKYLSGLLVEQHSAAQVRFNYLGRFDDELNNDLFVYEEVVTGFETDRRNKPTCPIELNCYCIDGCFKFEIVYDTACFIPETIGSFLRDYVHSLRELINNLSEVENRSFSLSDLDTCELDEGDLKYLFN